MIVNNLIFCDFFKSALKTLKAILDALDAYRNGTEFLWLNKRGKY